MKQSSSIFLKHTSIRSKIMVPFVVIIAVMAVTSMFISIYTVTNTIEKNTEKLLKVETTTISQYESTIIESMTLIESLIPKFSSLSASIFDNKPTEGKENNNFQWDNVHVYTSPEKLPLEKKIAYEGLLELGYLGKSQTIPYIFHDNNRFNISLVSVSGKKIKENKWQPIIAEFPITEAILNHMEYISGSTLALVFFGHLDGENRSEILTASEIIKKNTSLQRHIKRAIRHKTHESFTSKVKVATTTFTVFFQKSHFHPNMYIATVKTSEEMLEAKIRIIAITIMVLLLMSILIFAIYALIIQRITTSIDILTSISEKIAKGDLDQQVYLDASDEIGELSHIFNQMVTNLKESSINLTNEKERSEAIISCIPEGIIVTDQDNRLILANHKAEDMFNFSLNEVQGKFLLEHINNKDMISALNDKHKQSNKPILQEVVIPGENGASHIYQLTSSLVGNKMGKIIGVITILRDMTHEKQIEELREGFLRTVSHELRTPLTSVIGFIELVKSGEEITKDQKGYLETALNEASNLRKLIDDLLDLSQIKAGKMKMQCEEVAIKSLIDNVIHSLSPIAKGKGLQLTSSFKKEEITIYADPTKLRRIFINLISNAIKFTEKGTIAISVKNKKNHVSFSVKDTGIGLREEEKDVIFEKFRQIDYSSRREYEGIGLGLSIVKQLVEMHHGSITVESTYEKGSTFTFTIQKQNQEPNS
jgi:PAS domain S-box-containing protein